LTRAVCLSTIRPIPPDQSGDSKGRGNIMKRSCCVVLGACHALLLALAPAAFAQTAQTP
jgi:hypothetical protein